MVVDPKKHVLSGFANKFLVCNACEQPVLYWHNPDKCGECNERPQLIPCHHETDTSSLCPTWDKGCQCKNPEAQHRKV